MLVLGLFDERDENDPGMDLYARQDPFDATTILRQRFHNISGKAHVIAIRKLRPILIGDTPQPLKRRGFLGQHTHRRAYAPTDLSGPVSDVDRRVVVSVER